jgi:hypothetical protein
MSIGPGIDEGGRQSTSPNNLNMIGAPGGYACSHCSLSFPTRDLLEKHEVMHAQNTTVVSFLISLFFIPSLYIFFY